MLRLSVPRAAAKHDRVRCQAARESPVSRNGSMRLVFLLNQSLEYPSGLGRYWPLCRELARLGHRTTMLCLHPSFASLAPRRFHREGVDVRYVAQMHVRQEGSVRSYYASWELPFVVAGGTVAMARALRKLDVDALHIAKAQPGNGLAALVRPDLWRKGSVYLDSDDYEAGSNNFQSGAQQRLVALIEDGIARRVRAVTTNTTFTAARLQGIGVARERILLVPNGVERERVRAVPAGLPDELRRRYGLEGTPLLAYVGSLSLANHCVDLMLRAFASAHEQRSDLRLALVGGGEDMVAMQALARELGLGESARFIGRVDPVEALAWTAAADLSLDPAIDDPAHRARAPLKIPEAMAVGTPVITSDVGDRAEVIGGDAAGFLVPPGDSEALAQAMVDALSDQERLRAMGRRASEMAESLYWDHLVHRFLRVYDLAS